MGRRPSIARLTLRDGLPFVAIEAVYGQRSIAIPHVLIDTGSAGSMLQADLMSELGIQPTPEDDIRVIRGVGGSEAVFLRKLRAIEVGECHMPDFLIEIGGMDYGFEIHGILGMDFRQRANAQVDIEALELRLAC